jgi:hypothetical protein
VNLGRVDPQPVVSAKPQRINVQITKMIVRGQCREKKFRKSKLPSPCGGVSAEAQTVAGAAGMGGDLV